MKVLVVGTGAREHAIADALKDDVELYCYMSKVNPGISKIAEFAQGDEGEIEKVAKFAVDNNIDIAFIGPEAPLGKGIVDELEKNADKDEDPIAEEVINKEEVFKDFDDEEDDDFDEETDDEFDDDFGEDEFEDTDMEGDDF